MRTLASAGASDLPHCTHHAGCVSPLCSAVTALIFRSLCCTANKRQTRQLSVEQLDYLLCCAPASARSPWNSQPQLKSAAFGCPLGQPQNTATSAEAAAASFRLPCLSVAMELSRTAAFGADSAPLQPFLLQFSLVLDWVLSAFVYPPRSVVTHVHLTTLASH